MKDEINIKMPGQILDYVDTKEHLLELFNYITNLQEEKIQLEGKIKQLEHNCKQASDSCRQHRLASKNHIRRLKKEKNK